MTPRADQLADSNPSAGEARIVPGQTCAVPERAIRLFASDLDATLLGDPESEQRFKATWKNLPRETRPLLVYATGRSVSDTLDLVRARRLPAPDYILGGIGTEFHDARHPGAAPDFVVLFGEGWNLAMVERVVGGTPGVRRQPPEFLHPYKSSWYLERAARAQIDELRRRLKTADLKVNVIYSSRRDLDVLPARAGKGNALEWLCRRLSLPLEHVLVAGDTGNDSSMFLLPGVKGIAVANARPELFEDLGKLRPFVATKTMADGVLEGLRHFGAIPVQPRPGIFQPSR